jgi:glucan phosphoethanolaminetransferase (alkaline phosphatase superfamily)
VERGTPTRRLAPWLQTSAAAAVAATVLDALLLQRRRSYFTGGFLSADHVQTWDQGLAFLLGSLTADFAVLLVLVALARWLLTRLSLGPRVASVGALILALIPVAITDFANYGLQAFLGDAFDFALLFELAGRNPAEILAVSSEHLWTIGGGGAVGLAGLLAAYVALRHRARRVGTASTAGTGLPSGGQFVAISATALLAAGALTTVLRSASDTLDNGLRRKPTGIALGNAVAALSDVDRDGYGLLGRLRDPAPLDSTIYPYALDVPGNGVDEDGVGGDLPKGAAYIEDIAPAPRWSATPPIVLVALESFRADAVGASVSGRPVTPVLDMLGARGLSLQRAFSHNGYTIQSREHVFSGSLAGLRGSTTLVDDFNANGYETAYFSGQDESFGGADVGFLRAATHYDARDDRDKRYSIFSTAGSLAVPYDLLLERIGAFLRQRARQRPLFLYVNFHDTHFPYHHRSIASLLEAPVLPQGEIRPEHRDALRAMYLNTAANVDAAIGQLLTMVREAVGREPAVIVLSDHGESLFDEGFLGHGYALNDAQSRIPLVASGLPLQLTEPFGQIDLRDAIRNALTVWTANAKPQRLRDPRKTVFQYLGNVDRPAQIAFTGLTTRVAYDFRTGRAHVGDGIWRHPDELTGQDVQAVVELIRFWERIRLAQAAKPSEAAR